MIKPEIGSAMVADADLHKVLRLSTWFDLECKPLKDFVKVTVVGRKC